MVGQELVTEGFKPGQVGSSAMPHKMNTRSSERVNGLAVIVRGYLSMVGELAGDQWNEGDVSCSVVRRVALPDAFFATDGLFQTFLTVLDEFGAYPAVIARELDRFLPFLATTKILVAAVRKGVGREVAHEVIKEHAVAVALAMREKGAPDNDLFDRLAADGRLQLSRSEIDTLVADRAAFVGAAPAQVRALADRVAAIVAAHPDAARYAPRRSCEAPRSATDLGDPGGRGLRDYRGDQIPLATSVVRDDRARGVELSARLPAQRRVRRSADTGRWVCRGRHKVGFAVLTS